MGGTDSSQLTPELPPCPPRPATTAAGSSHSHRLLTAVEEALSAKQTNAPEEQIPQALDQRIHVRCEGAFHRPVRLYQGSFLLVSEDFLFARPTLAASRSSQPARRRTGSHTGPCCWMPHHPLVAAVQKEMTGKDPRESLPLSYLHIDCDLYAGSRDALTLLSHKIVPGTVLLFDELVNYNTYREHEVRPPCTTSA